MGRVRLTPLQQRAALEQTLSRYRPLFDTAGWADFIDSLCRPLPVALWGNPSRIDAAGLSALLAADGIPATPIPWRGQDGGGALRLPAGVRAGQRWWYCAGLAHAQEEASQLPATLLDVRPGQRVLDLCAAPGGKTAQLAFLLGNRGTLVANDISPERLAALQGNLDRLGIVNVSTTQADGGNWPAAAGGFDRILVDAPCSSEGTLRRNASLVGRLRPDRSAHMLPRQRALLTKAVQLCRPGGRIVYSTCTFAPEENELIVAAALAAAQGRLRLLPVTVPGLLTSPGLTQWQGERLPAELARCLRLWPQHNDTGGFFVAVLEKTADAPPPPAPAAAPPATLDDADRAALTALTDHYGLPATLWRDYRAARQTRRGLHLMAADHQPPATPRPQASGLFALRTNIRPPKLTTAAALLLGRQGSRRLVLDAAGRDRYLAREAQTLNAAGGLAPGQWLVEHAGVPLGVARLHASGTLESLFPTRWSGRVGGKGAGEARDR